MFFFRPAFIIAQLIKCFAFVCMFARIANAAPTPQFGIPWRHTDLATNLPANGNKAIAGSESAPASATSTLDAPDIDSSTLVGAILDNV